MNATTTRGVTDRNLAHDDLASITLVLAAIAILVVGALSVRQVNAEQVRQAHQSIAAATSSAIAPPIPAGTP